MKCILVAALAIACVLGLASANYYGYGGVGASGGLGGDGGLLMLIGLLFLLMFLFNGRTSSSQTTTLAFINGTG